MLDLLYAQAVRTRRRWFERHPSARRRLHSPVISVGNLSVGGSGKTPLVRAITEWLIAQGERPAILSRGYGRRDRVDGVTVVSDAVRVLAEVATAGDEPLMLARALSAACVVVAEDRYLAGVVAERRLGATVHVLDDGFQHLTLARDLDVLVTQAGEIDRERVLPFGRLREPVDAAARADLVVIMGADQAAARTEAWALGISQFVTARRAVAGPPQDGRPVVAVAGIANPSQFVDSLRAAGWNVAGSLAFRDHHPYSRRDVERIDAAVRDRQATAVVTTEKDAVRLEPLAPLPFVLDVAAMTLEVEDRDTLERSIAAAIARRREQVFKSAAHAGAGAHA